MTMTIPLSRGMFALVDDADFERVSELKWNAAPARQITEKWYAQSHEKTDAGPRNVYLHRYILRAPKGVLVDHKNNDGLDCRRLNLRLATRRQNLINRTTTARSGYRGVALEDGRYRARVWEGKRSRQIGAFATPEEAAKAYDDAARQLYGEWAKLNFPDGGLA